MFQKGQRVITPFGVGTIASVQASACVVELITDGRKRIGTFVNEKLKVCSIIQNSEVKIQNDEVCVPEPMPQADETKIGELSYFPKPTPQPITPPKRKRGTKRSA